MKFTIFIICKSTQFSSVVFALSWNRLQVYFTSCKCETLYSLINSLFLLPFPLVTTILFSISVNLTTLDTSHKWSYTVFVFCDCLISLNVMSLRFSHVLAYIRIFFLLKAEKYFIVCIYNILFIYSSIDGHLNYFHFSSMNNTSMNMNVLRMTISYKEQNCLIGTSKY